MITPSRVRAFPALLLFLALCSAHAADTPMLDLSDAVVLVRQNPSPTEEHTLDMLLDEVEKRTRIRWDSTIAWPTDAKSVILVGTFADLPKLAPALTDAIQAGAPSGSEGYVVKTIASAQGNTIIVTGNTPTGVLFGVGRLLRELRMTRDSVQLPLDLAINSAPKTPLRGHQLGFRPKVNTYDAWTVEMWEQYLRDLAVFGTNSVELIPPRSDDDADSPHFPLPPLEMMARMSQLAHDYGMAVWVWYPALDKDYSDTATVERALAEWNAVFKAVPHIDVVFVPGGDPGHTPPTHLMALLEKQTEVLRRSHPHAQMWMSPQGFNLEWTTEFLGIMKDEQPTWLSGVVFAPQNRMSLPEMRAAVPAQYPIRHYPDITHSYSCQYPVQDWDTAYKLTQDREVINPRPRAYADIVRWSLPYTNGFITYSEGCNDDLNKMLWSALGWDSEADVYGILREYARYFIGPEYEDTFAQALMALERNWEGPLLTNTGVTVTLQQVRDMERAASPQVRLNWRFQQVLYRAYYDAYVRQRLIRETELEERANAVLARAQVLGPALAMDEAEAILNEALLEPIAADLRSRVSDMAEALYQSIRMQLSVPRYQAIDIGRGANFDLIDRPLNNRLWLRTNFERIRALDDDRERLAEIDALVNWCNPGPGGFYDDLGDPSNQPHLVRELTTDFDPENRIEPLLGYAGGRPIDRRISWFGDAETRFEAPLTMRYADLDPTVQYTVRAVYAGDKFDTQVRLVADDNIEVHPFIDKAVPLRPVEFDIPSEATADGALTLTWTQTPGRGSAGRGCQVTEVWLIRKGE